MGAAGEQRGKRLLAKSPFWPHAIGTSASPSNQNRIRLSLMEGKAPPHSAPSFILQMRKLRPSGK